MGSKSHHPEATGTKRVGFKNLNGDGTFMSYQQILYVAACCSVLQRVAVCCGVMWCVAKGESNMNVNVTFM